MSAVKNLSIRLAAVGGDKVRQEFKNLGTDGDKAFRRITQVITPANDNLKALDATARSFNEVKLFEEQMMNHREVALTSIYTALISVIFVLNRHDEQISTTGCLF